MDLILPLPVTGQYKQKSRGCHASSAAATGPEGFCGYCLNPVLCSPLGSDFLFDLAEAAFQRSHGKVRLLLID
jgi:hypothetical protein